MATVNHSQQSFAQRDPAVAASPDNARWGSAGTRGESAPGLRANPSDSVHSGTAELTYPVLFRLADVSGISAGEELVHLTSLEIDSALESIGSGKASLNADVPGHATNLAANSFASLLAASPSLQRTRTTENAPAPAATTAPEVARSVVPPARSKVQAYEAAPVEPAPEQSPADSPKLQQRIDRPAIKPLRRPFRITRPAWMPEIPPTLVLGMLICFSALLVGMLWSGNEAETPSNAAPAAHDHRPVDSTKAKVATVPEVPNTDETGSANVRVRKTAGRASSNKVSKSTRITSKQKPIEVANQGTTEATSEPIYCNVGGEFPSPRITGIRALPPVESYTRDNFYGQPIGGPAPQIVENPHVGRQNPVLEARRPTAEFQGNITPPDAAAHNERF
jgi:hypothetical protein